jgi:hypothetical protein
MKSMSDALTFIQQLSRIKSGAQLCEFAAPELLTKSATSTWFFPSAGIRLQFCKVL